MISATFARSSPATWPPWCSPDFRGRRPAALERLPRLARPRRARETVTMAVEIGQQAPDFELRDQSGNEVSLSSFRGSKAVALVFYPFTFTGVCEGELCQLRDDITDFDAAGVQVLAVSCDSRHAQKVWAEEKGYNFPVLSDFWPHGEVARAYGVF